jgi:hypothetical protein
MVLLTCRSRPNWSAGIRFGSRADGVCGATEATVDASTDETKLSEFGGEGGIRTHVPLARQDAFEAPPLRPLRYLSARAGPRRAAGTFDYTSPWWPLKKQCAGRTSTVGSERASRPMDAGLAFPSAAGTNLGTSVVRGTTRPPRGRRRCARGSRTSTSPGNQPTAAPRPRCPAPPPPAPRSAGC